MYNRYIPQPDGSYRRSRVQDQPRPQPQKPPEPQPAEPECVPPPPPPKPAPQRRQERSRPRQEQSPAGMDAGSFLKKLLPKDLDTGDLMIILLLLLMAGDCQEDQNTALLTLALYLFL